MTAARMAWALMRAEEAAPDARAALAVALCEAAIEIERLPALRRCQIISSYAGIMLSDTGRETRRGRPAG